ncbi:MAG: energy transducer TonB [Methylococcales bacterium]|nr:energy transducer TonB [Methylococcales bacterium]
MSSSNTIECNYPAFNPLGYQKKSRLMACLLSVLVVALHVLLSVYMLNAPIRTHTKPPVVMEVVMLPKPEPIVKVVQQVVKEPPPPPKPTPIKKSPVKPKPVVKPPIPIIKPAEVKKPAVVKKVAPIQAPSKEEIPIPAVIAPRPVFVPTPSISAKPTSAASATANASTRGRATAATTSGHGQDNSKSVVSGVVALVRVPPKYPARALSRRIEGWVKVEFTIRPDGSVDNAVVVGSEPEAIFNEAALAAIAKWKFKEKTVNGVAVAQKAVQKIGFKLPIQ